MSQEVIRLPEIVGKGYKDFWNFKGRYRVCKGSRASKKSTTTALNLIYRLMKYPDSNILVIRKVFRTLKDSSYSLLKWAIKRLNVEKYFTCKESPLEIIYEPTGQKILFRGLDDAMKIASVTVAVGYLCWCWIEEAYELTSENDFNMIDEAIRGGLPNGLFKQITLTFNPWNQRHWLKKRFFDTKSPDILAKTTNYLCNEWLDQKDLEVFERMKNNDPRRYQVSGLGNWGVTEGLVYENWQEQQFDIETVTKLYKCYFGLDFGYTHDPTAFVACAVNEEAQIIYVFDEIYEKGMTNKAIAAAITAKGYQKERITADSSEPKSIDNLKFDYGLKGVRGARKGKDSINNGIQYVQGFKILVHPKCKNFITELANYQWDKDKTGQPTNVPKDEYNHLLDALRYAVEGLTNQNKVIAVNKEIFGIR